MSGREEFRWANRWRTLNRSLQIALTLTLAAGLNYLAARHYLRLDLTPARHYTLSPETLAYLRELSGPIQVVVTVPADSDRREEQLLHRYVRDLLAEYAAQATRPEARLEVTWVDPFRRRAESERLARRFPFLDTNQVIVATAQRHKLLRPADLIEVRDNGSALFRGEQALTTALLEVTASEQARLYFTLGHGEMRLDDPDPARGLTELARELQARNYALFPLDLASAPEVPEDATAVFLLDPRGPFSESETTKLRHYLADRAGRVILTLGPSRAHGLEKLLDEWGVLSDDMLLLETGRDYQQASGQLLIRQFGAHPITEALLRGQLPVAATLCRPMRPDPGAPADNRLTVNAILGSSGTSWAERHYQKGHSPTFDQGVDLGGPVPLGVVAERRPSSQLGINLSGGRLVALGASDVFANRLLGNLGNYTLLFSALHWAMDRTQWLGIPPRPIESYQLSLSQEQLARLPGALAILPACCGVVGLLLYWSRRT